MRYFILKKRTEDPVEILNLIQIIPTIFCYVNDILLCYMLY